jgi:hypothetical protein
MTIKCHIGLCVPLTKDLNFIFYCHLRQSSLLSLKYWIIKVLKLTNIEESCFWPKSLNKSNNLQKNWWIIFSYIIFILHLKFHTKITYSFIFEKYFSYFIFLMYIILVQIYSSHINFLFFVDFEELSKSSSKIFKYF